LLHEFHSNHSQVTDEVHKRGSFIFCQLWALGRSAEEEVLKAHNFDVVSASDIPLTKGATPRPLSLDEIKRYMSHFAIAARNAVRAGFDGIEIHGANGYLVDQFLQDVTNKRTDEYGGSVENRCRFALEVIQACVDSIGAEKTAIRLSPWGMFQGTRNTLPEARLQINTICDRNANERPSSYLLSSRFGD
jgi:NADPH2 dehydrogenase